MALLIIIFLYAITGLCLYLLASIDMSNELRLAFNLIGGIGALVLPIAIYSTIDFRLTKKIITAIGKDFCIENGKEFVRVELHKNHYTVVFKSENEKPKRQKFRVLFVPTTWNVKRVEWLTKEKSA